MKTLLLILTLLFSISSMACGDVNDTSRNINDEALPSAVDTGSDNGAVIKEGVPAADPPGN